MAQCSGFVCVTCRYKARRHPLLALVSFLFKCVISVCFSPRVLTSETAVEQHRIALVIFLFLTSEREMKLVNKTYIYRFGYFSYLVFFLHLLYYLLIDDE